MTSPYLLFAIGMRALGRRLDRRRATVCRPDRPTYSIVFADASARIPRLAGQRPTLAVGPFSATRLSRAAAPEKVARLHLGLRLST